MSPTRTDRLVIGAGAAHSRAAGAAAGVDVLSTSAITAPPRRPDLGLDFLGLR